MSEPTYSIFTAEVGTAEVLTVSRLKAKSGVVELLAAAGAVMRFQIWLPTITLGQNTGISERILFKSIFITTREIC
jgi:hypothetical protein